MEIAILLALIAVALFAIAGNDYHKEEGRGKDVSLRNKLASAAKPLKDGGKPGKPSPTPRRGDEIFEHSGGPRTWDEYIGQHKAKMLLRMRIASAVAREETLDHVLIASGFPGIGKSALARIIAAELGAGIVEIQGDVGGGDEAAALFGKMKDGDVLFIDEIHKLMDGGKRGIEWLLPLLQDGVLITPEGIRDVPEITVIGATTDKDILPQTILDRFPIVPPLEQYSIGDASEIAAGMAERAGADFGPGVLEQIAAACGETPRLIAGMIPNVRDAELAGMIKFDEDREGSIEPLLELLDITRDGLDAVAQNMLLALLSAGGTQGAATLAAKLNEPTLPKHAERVLMGKGYVVIQPQGRCLTDEGRKRAGELAEKYAVGA